MPYQVFARKYRPQTFAQVVGQEHITQSLSNAIKMGRLAQAYLLVGPRGTGKTSTARIIAKALNCSNGPTIDFDPNEEICQEIAEGRCMDVLEIDGASNNGVDQVRDLRDNVRFAPTRGKFKVYIIDEVHMLTPAAFNALLKTLEEPPAHVKFILATTEVHKILPTVLSRCQRFDFRRIPEARMTAHLRWICEQEQVSAEAGALEMIARQADGGLRDAEVALDQVIGFFGQEIREESVRQMFGLTGLQPVLDLATALVRGDSLRVLSQSRALVDEGKDLGRLAQDLLKFFRNLAIYQLSPAAIEEEVTPSELSVLGGLASETTRHGTLALLEELSTFESRLRHASSKEVLFEISLLQLAQLKEKVSLEAVLRSLSLDSREQGPTAAPAVSAPAIPAPVPKAAPKPESRAEAPVPSPVPSTGATASASDPGPVSVPAPVKSIDGSMVWAQAVARFAAERPLEAGSIQLTRFLAKKGDAIEVALPKNLLHKIAFFSAPKNLPLLEEVLRQEYGQSMKIAFLAVDDPVSTPAADLPAKAAEKEPPKVTETEFKNDPLIREALQLFKARVIPASR